MAASEALSGEQFRMHTNIGVKPGSQGTLFQGGYGKTWSRGFTPERRNEVRDALGWAPHRLRGQGGRPAQHPEGGAHPDNVRAIETIARSTVPAEHLHDVELIAGQAALAGMEPATRGVYRRARDTARSGSMSEIAGKSRDVHIPAKIGLLKGVAESHTPLHEIGHHVSATRGLVHSNYDTPSRRGTEEGYAENYAETHFRDRRGRQQPTGNTSTGWEKYEATQADQHTFRLHFEQQRRKSPLAPKQFDHTKMSKKERELPPEHVNGQMALLDKVGGTGHIEEYAPGRHRYKRGPRDWDYTYDDQREKGLVRERW